jgi:hypothetical protein
VIIARGVLFKASRFVDLWRNFLGLFVITLILFSLCVWRFRKQLSWRRYVTKSRSPQEIERFCDTAAIGESNYAGAML